LDADELLVFADHDSQDLHDLTAQLDRQGQTAFGALMLDMYPKGSIDQSEYAAGADPMQTLQWFDAAPYRATRQMPKENLWVQGGVRERVFFANAPKKGPTLNKLPLVKWNSRFAYVNSTHAILPAALNHAYEGPGETRACGVLLHTKFLNVAIEKSAEEKARKQHFGAPEDFEDYYDQVIAGPNLWAEHSVLYQGWRQLEELGLLSRGV
jgi:hypothetical protein